MKELRELMLGDRDGSFTTDLIAQLQHRLRVIRAARLADTAIEDELLESCAEACCSAIHVVELFASGRSR